MSIFNGFLYQFDDFFKFFFNKTSKLLLQNIAIVKKKDNDIFFIRLLLIANLHESITLIIKSFRPLDQHDSCCVSNIL